MNQSGRRTAPVRVKSPLLEKWGPPKKLSLVDLPRGLSQVPNAPEHAYLWGTLPPLPWVSIVGTRRPTPSGVRDAFYLARRLSRAGVTIASGGACGIDSAAHLGALAGRGATIVIAPTWLPFAYPLSNHRLFQRILVSGGAYLTVADENTRPMKFAFFRRNEVLMALSHATVLGECPRKSGAKNAMLHARKLGRARFALPFRFGDKRALGLWTEIVEQGAELLAEETPLLRLLEEYGEFENEIWRGYIESGRVVSSSQSRGEQVDSEMRRSVPFLGDSSQSRSKRSRGSQGTLPAIEAFGADRSEAEKSVLRAVLRGAGTVDALCRATSLPPEEVQHIVLVLTLSGELADDDQGLLRLQRLPSAKRSDR